ncbi:MAG: hypothetical protein LBH85_01225 [Treponema sp.]|nr:hypothetical protein [Treponema sp.]
MTYSSCPLPRAELLKLLNGVEGACPKSDCAMTRAFNRNVNQAESEKKRA